MKKEHHRWLLIPVCRPSALSFSLCVDAHTCWDVSVEVIGQCEQELELSFYCVSCDQTHIVRLGSKHLKHWPISLAQHHHCWLLLAQDPVNPGWVTQFMAQPCCYLVSWAIARKSGSEHGKSIISYWGNFSVATLPSSTCTPPSTACVQIIYESVCVCVSINCVCVW